MLKKALLRLYDYVKYQKGYSQDGEDIILHSFMEPLPKGYKGFYVDVGAHHPMRFSNTYFYYKLGWTGINIDAMPGSMKSFSLFRKRDTNLELGVAESPSEMTFYCLNEPALNTFSKELAEYYTSFGSDKIVQTKIVKVLPLSMILEEYLPKNQNIDFFSIDVEGLDLMVLKSNDWKKYRPKYLLCEDNTVLTLADIDASEVYNYIRSVGYVLIGKTKRTMIFREEY